MVSTAQEISRALANRPIDTRCLYKTLLLGTAIFALATAPAIANPTGGQVTIGAATISSSNNTTSVKQTSEGVVINWSSFNIGNGQTTQFYQPNAKAIAVNRIGSKNASQILGTLDANGNVVLINGNGILFGKGAKVDVGSLVATSTDGTDSDLLSGKFTKAGSQSASIVNRGVITVDTGGTVALVAPNVTNTGTVNAKLGTVSLGAANKFTVDLNGDGLVSFAAQGDVNGKASVINRGRLVGANVSMTAHAAEGIATGVVNTSGVIVASSAHEIGGTIVLDAGDGGSIDISRGKLEATGPNGGGTITVGRWDDAGVTVNSGSVLNASATKTGDGGHIKVVSNSTSFAGNALAQGGILSGNGGLIETSGDTLDFLGATVSARATNGKSGTWLLDPDDLIIGSSDASSILSTLNGGTDVSLQTTSSGCSGGFGACIPGSGDIDIDSALSWNTTATLTLDAYRNIDINSAIMGPAGGLTLDAANSISASGAVDIGQFTLQSGAWNQNTASLPAFSATDFTISGGSFLRVTGGDGSASPYQIADIYGLQGVSSSSALSTDSYVLANGIDATETAGWNSGAGFAPIGSNFEFTGTFDGQGHTISNLTINLPSAEYVGLFGASGGTIQNVGLIGGSVSGHAFVGALVGVNAGTIDNSYAATAVGGGAGSSYVGGLVGDNLGTITNSYATGAVSGGSYVGGLAGQNDVFGAISDSYATGAASGGSYVGGFVGQNFTTANIDQSYETGAVSGGSNVGGFAGHNDGALGQTTANYFNSTANSGSGVGSGSGFSHVGGLSFAAMQTASSFSGWTFGTTGGASGWVIVDHDSTLNNAGAAGGTTPMLLTEYSTTIANAHQLQLMALDLAATYSLANNIDATGTAGGDVWSSQGFVPLGTYDGFTGIFDGQGHTISNLAINLPSGEFVGLFGVSDGKIENVGLIGGSVSGQTFVGALVGLNQGTIENSYTATAVSGSVGGSYVGGLVGDNLQGTITNSYAAGAVSGGSYVGGLVGQNDLIGTISDSYATGTVSGGSSVGGFVGQNFTGANIDQSYETGAVSGGSYVGGFAGYNGGSLGSATADYFNRTANGGSGVGGGAGFNRGGGLLFGAMQTVSNFSGWTFGTTGGASGWVIVDHDSTLNNAGAAGGTTPMLLTEYSTTIANAHQLQLMALDLAATYTLANNIDATRTAGSDVWGSQGFAPIGNIDTFIGTFDGQGHTISNLTINLPSAEFVGLFGASGGTIENVGLIGGSVSGQTNVGALVGANAGIIDNSYATTAVSGSTGGSHVGGLVGDNELTITNSYATGAVSASGSSQVGGLAGYLDGGSVSTSFATGDVSGATAVGGLVGESEEGAISNSYAMGSVSGSSQVGGLVGALFDPSSSVTDSYSIGRVTGSTAVGGLVGLESDTGGVTDSYWDTQTSGQSSDGAGAVPLTTAQMQGTFTNMPGFSSTTWATGAGLFPYLPWQFAGTPQAVSGVAYSNGGGTALQGGTVSTLLDGNALGTASTGANGYYYLLVAPGTISGSNHAVLAYSSANGARADTATDALDANDNVSGFDVWGDTLIAPTSDTTYSTASATGLQTQDAALIAQAVGSNTDPTSGLTNYGYIAAGSGFTIDQPLTLSNGLYVKTTSGNIGVDDALTLPGSVGLALDSFGALTVDAPISVTGAGAVALDYDSSSPTNLSFGLTSSGFTGGVSYGSTNNGGTLSINGATYTLLYSMTDLQNINNNLTGNYALATSLDASLVSSWTPLGIDSSGVVLNSDNGFSGAFEGLGNTVSNLTMNGTNNGTIEGAGLFGDSAFGSIRDIGLSGISIISSNAYIGGLVGLDGNANTASYGSTIADSYVTGSVRGYGAVGGLVGKDGGATIDGSYTTAAVNAGRSAGGLVGEFVGGAITESYATGAVSALIDLGGLVGSGTGTISASYATGTVTVTGGGAGIAGGLIGGGAMYVSDSYATGAVDGGIGERIGGFAGELGSGTITTSYSTGRVSGGTTLVGGFVGEDYTTGGITNSYWEMDTSGIGASQGAGNISNDSGIAGVTSTTTSGLQGGALPTGFSNATWGIGIGVYPYFLWQYPSGTPQTITGYAFTNAGVTVDAGDTVAALMNGNALTSGSGASVGANGYYYIVLAPDTISNSGAAVLAYTSSGAHLEDLTGTPSQFDIWGSTLIAPTSDATYSTASAASLQTQDASLIAQAVGSNSAVAAEIAGLSGQGYVATGSSFTIDEPLTLSSALYVETSSSSSTLTVADPLTLAGSNTLELNAAGALTIDAPITITGAGELVLDYDTSQLTDLSFGLTSSGFTGSVNYGATDNGGTLTINGTSYTLLYSMTEVQNINSNLSGDFALATSLDATSTTGWVPIGTAGNSFGGTFEGLGNTISNLTVDLPSVSAVGLFGYATGSVFRDLGVVGGSFTGADLVGGLVGENLQGTIANAYATGSVSGDSEVGGLVGNLDFLATITNAYATGAVSGSLEVGGLVGRNDGSTITNAYATGAVDDIGSGLSQYFGGLVGQTFQGEIANSYATGAVMGSGSGISEYGGGLVGRNDGGIIDAYATGAVGGFRVVGGLVGVNDGGIFDAYATGTVSGNANVGGLVGGSMTGAVLTDGYWDTQTSGIGTDGGGAAPLTTAEMQGTFANMPGFAGPTWSTGTGLYPYLSWQFNGTPQATSGTVFSGSTKIAGENVGILIGGSAVMPAITAGSGANGYYYLLLAPGTISGSGSDVVTYLTSGTPANTFVQNATGSLSSVDLFENTFVAASHASDSAAILAEIPTALGSASGSQFLYTASSGVVSGINLAIFDTASAFTLDSSLDVGNATLELYTTGSDTQTAGTITANKLISVSTGGLSLGQANAIAELGNIGNSGAGGITVTDNHALTVDGDLSTGADAIDLTTTGSGNGIAIDDHLIGGTVDLVSADTIRENGSDGFIHASVLEGSSGGLAFFNKANKIGSLGDFTAGGAFSLYDWETLDVTGELITGKHSITLDAQIGDIDIGGALLGATISLTSVAGEVEGAGIIDANVLNVSADTGIDLYGANNDIQTVGTDTTNSGPNTINKN